MSNQTTPPARMDANLASAQQTPDDVQITVHDFAGEYSGDVYDQTQTDCRIKDGDVLDLGCGNVAILVQAWPTIVAGDIEHFHTLAPGETFESLADGRYAASALKAVEVSRNSNLRADLEPHQALTQKSEG